MASKSVISASGTGTVVLVGPTMPASEVLELLPGADVRKPASAGDILRLATARKRPVRIALIDGYFERMAAPWHKEICYALERGIAVFGAGSLGAVRAAELAPMGMVGCGKIYQGYLRGELVADDEVAVTHAPAERGYASATVALVNVRFALLALAQRRRITTDVAAQVLAAAAAVFYRERDVDAILSHPTLDGLPASAHQLLRRAWQRGMPDQKRTDARALLRLLAQGPSPVPATITVPRTWAFRMFAEQLGLTLRSLS